MSPPLFFFFYESMAARRRRHSLKMRAAARVKNNSLFISTIPICPREGETKVEREEGRQTDAHPRKPTPSTWCGCRHSSVSAHSAVLGGQGRERQTRSIDRRTDGDRDPVCLTLAFLALTGHCATINSRSANNGKRGKPKKDLTSNTCLSKTY